MRTAILASGGLDSFLAWELLHHHYTTTNVFVDVGQKYLQKERQAVQRLADAIQGFPLVHVKAANLSAFELPSGIIPNRNAHLILAAATVAERIALGVLKGEINSDKSQPFFFAMEFMLNIANRGQYWNGSVGKKYEVFSPLRDKTKSEAIADYLRRGKDPGLLHLTVSCYAADGERCGRCPSCFKRWVAMVNNGLHEAYDSPPLDWAQEQGILRKCTDGTYGPDRAAEILQAVGKQ